MHRATKLEKREQPSERSGVWTPEAMKDTKAEGRQQTRLSAKHFSLLRLEELQAPNTSSAQAQCIQEERPCIERPSIRSGAESENHDRVTAEDRPQMRQSS